MRFPFFLFFFVIISFYFPANSQKLSAENKFLIAKNEEELIILADSMLRAPLPDDRPEFGFQFAKLLKETLEIEGSADYAFEKLSQKIHILTPDNKSFKIFNWLIAPSEIIRRYYGIIQMQNGKLTPLYNYADRMKEDVLSTTLDNKHWYGCEYYRIQEVSAGKQKYYTLFGLNKDGNYSYKKILDVLYFIDDTPYFGAPVFSFPNESGSRLRTLNRVIWEYSPEAQFSLNYDDEYKMIMFDRLRSKINNPLRKNTYIPTGQTDGLKWEKKKWFFVKEAIPILKLDEGGAPIDGVIPSK